MGYYETSISEYEDTIATLEGDIEERDLQIYQLKEIIEGLQDELDQLMEKEGEAANDDTITA